MTVCVIGGLGYVGLVTSAGLVELGHTVTVFDVDEARLARLRGGQVPFHEPGLPELLKRGFDSGRLRLARSLGDALRDARVVFIAVGTPARTDGETDLAQIIAAAEGLATELTKPTIVAIKSTVPMGTGRVVKRILDAHGRVEGADYELVAVPEFLREGNAVYDFLNPTRIVIGGQRAAARAVVRELFSTQNAPVIETTFEQALLIKYASNAFLAMRVSFANELAELCDEAGVDVLEVLNGMGHDNRIGKAYLSPGIGFGGPCLEKDLRSLIRIAEGTGYEPAFLRSILEKNEHQIRQTIRRGLDLLGPDLYARTVSVLGLAFKPGTSDVRNSLAVRIIDRLQRGGAKVRAHDPLANAEARHLLKGVAIYDDPYEAAQGGELLYVLNGSEEFKRLDLARLRAVVAAPNLVDGVNALNPAEARAAGFTYRGTGRR